MRAVKAALSFVVIALAVGLIAGLLMLFQRLLISGANMAGQWGDTSTVDQGASAPDDAIETFAPVEPKSTVPPGDDPSWSEPMDSAPVDQTAEELAKKR